MNGFILIHRGGRNKIERIGVCGKVGSKTKAKANKRMRQWGRRNGCTQVYQCRNCGLWHLTSHPR